MGKRLADEMLNKPNATDVEALPQKGPDQINTISDEKPNIDLLGSTAENHINSYEGFDPDAHAIGKDGKPKIKADGSFEKKRGRKKGEPLPSPDGSGTIPSVPFIQSATSKEAAEMAAKNTCNMIFNASVITMGEDWIPKKEEATGMCQAFTDYFMARGIPNIPPEIGLIAAIMAYALPRPQTQKLIKKGKEYFGVKQQPENTL